MSAKMLLIGALSTALALPCFADVNVNYYAPNSASQGQSAQAPEASPVPSTPPRHRRKHASPSEDENSDPSPSAAAPQSAPDAPEVAWTVTPPPSPHEEGLVLGGPRFGFTWISGNGLDRLKNNVEASFPGSDFQPYVSDIGWQFEDHLYRTSEGLTVLTEVVPIIGGLEQGLALPSLNLIVGLRTREGYEMGIGPNIGLGGASLVETVGYTFREEGVNFPVNISVGEGSEVTSLSLSTGFNL